MIVPGQRLFIFVIVFCMGSYYWAQGAKPQKEGVNMPSTVETIELKSSAFKPGEMIPKKYTCDAEDISPQISWSKIPGETKELALICDDPDAPMGIWVHWVIYGIPPATNNLSENVPKKDTIMGFHQGKNSFGKIGYGGPCPPPGSTHRYVFKLYALNVTLALKPGASKSDLVKAMDGHILAQGELIGLYGR